MGAGVVGGRGWGGGGEGEKCVWGGIIFFALITLKTPPCVSMVTASTIQRRRIPDGTQWFLLNHN